MYVLGINAAYHESAACLLRDGEVVAAIEEERLSRRKHGKAAEPTTGAELPTLAMAHCLNAAGIQLKDVEWVAYSLNPHSRLRNKDFTADPVLPGGWGSAEGEQRFFDDLQRVPRQMAELGLKGEFKWVNHHLAHAASAYHPSAFPEAAVLCVDGIAEVGSTLFAQGNGRHIQVLDEMEYPASIGFLWEKLAKFLGFSEYDACKVMGLASYGNPSRYLSQFQKLVSLEAQGRFSMDGTALRFRVEDYEPLETLFGLPRRHKGTPLRAEHQDVASALQEITNQVLSHMVNHLAARTGSRNLCMAGGVALNCVANRVAYEASSFERLYVQPAAHDAGTALGAALFVWHNLLGQEERKAMRHPYVGPSFSNEAIEQALTNARLPYRKVDNVEQAVAEHLAAGRIVGWFQGALEFGPRALGCRSLLADPRNPRMKQILNDRVKHREEFRPFAPSVLAEEAGKWFQIQKSSPTADFMLLAYPAREEVRQSIPAVVHVDGTSRIQTVRSETNPRYHRLISAFQRITGVPMVLNTSFNDNEPIVCTPEDAAETFRHTRIDVLAIGDYLVESGGGASQQASGASA